MPGEIDELVRAERREVESVPVFPQRVGRVLSLGSDAKRQAGRDNLALVAIEVT